MTGSVGDEYHISGQRQLQCYRLPEKVVTDNGPQFTSSEFSQFLATNGVKHICCSPYHPSSNGAAEQLVQTVKQALKAGCHKGVSFDRVLASFLLQYRTTPHATTGVSPSIPNTVTRSVGPMGDYTIVHAATSSSVLIWTAGLCVVQHKVGAGRAQSVYCLPF